MRRACGFMLLIIGVLATLSFACPPPPPVKVTPTFRVSVRDGGKPVGGVKVKLIPEVVLNARAELSVGNPTERPLTAITDLSGLATFSAPVGKRYRLVVDSPAESFGGENVTIAEDGTESVQATVTLQWPGHDVGEIEGNTVRLWYGEKGLPVDKKQEPVSGGTVQILDLLDGHLVAQSVSSDSGLVQLPGGLQGRYVISVKPLESPTNRSCRYRFVAVFSPVAGLNAKPVDIFATCTECGVGISKMRPE